MPARDAARHQLSLSRASLVFLSLVAFAQAQTNPLINQVANPNLGITTQTLNLLDVFSGTLTVGASGQSGGTLLMATDYSSGLSFVFTGTSSRLDHSLLTRTLTLTSSGTLTRTGAGSTSFFENIDNSGAVTVNGGTLFSNALLTNRAGATTTVTGSGSILNLASLANSGSLVADNSGQLRFTGAFTTANLGSIAITNGGVVEFANGSTLTNTSLVAPTGGSYLFNGTIVGGTIAANALTQSAGILDGASITGSFTVPSGASLTLKNNGGGTAGTATFGTAGLSGGQLLLATDTTLSSGLAFTGTSSRLDHTNALHTLTLTNTATLARTGAGSTSFFENIDNSGAVTVNGGTLFSNALLTNRAGATTTVTGSGSILNLATFANSGSFVADTNGQLRFTGAFTTANLGSIAITNGGVVEFASGSTLTNTSLVAPTGGSYLFNGTIVGGTIAANALTQSAGVLDGASITGSFTVPSGASLTLKNGGGWTAGTATFGTAGLSSGQLLLATDTTLSSGLAFTGTSSRLDHTNSLHTLTLTSTATLARTGAGSTSFFENIDNSGAVTVNGGTLFSNALLTNRAGATTTVTGSGSILNLATFANFGSLVADSSGQLRFTGAFTTANLGSVAITNSGVVEFANGSTLTNTSLVAPTGGSYLFNGTIVGGTIAANALTQSAGILDGASITGSFTVPSGASLTLKNNGGWTGGTATFGTAGLSSGQLLLATDTTLSSGLAFTGTSSRLDHTNALHTLTLTNTATLARTGSGATSFFENIDNSGVVTVNGGTLFSNASFTNQPGATTTVTGSGSILNLATFANSGSLVADSSGQLRLTGAFTTANLGSVAITNGGTVELANGSTLTNTSLVAPTGGSYLFNGTIVGGTVAANALTQSAGTLDGASITGSFTVPNGTSLTLKNNGGWTGTATFGAAGLSGGQLLLASDAILPSALIFTGSSSRLDNSSSIRTLTLTPTGTLTRTGAGSTSSFENIANGGIVTVNGGAFSSSGTLTNQAGGTIAVSAGASLSQTGVFTNNSGATATVTGAGSKLAVANVANAGALVSDSSGLLSLTGAFTTANLGSITLTNGGTVELANGSTLTNTNLVAPTGGSYLFNGTIVGGTVAANALTQSAGTLDGASITGSFIVPNGTSLTLKNNGGWTGTATFGAAGLSGGQLFLASDTILSSGLVFTGSSSRLDNSSSIRTLTLTSTGTLTRTGTGSTASFENIANGGTVTVNGGSFSSSGTLTNQAGGTIAVSAGASLSQTGVFTNNSGATATVTGTGSKLAVANVANSGALVSDTSGLLSLTGAFTTANLGSITLTNSGTVELANGSTLTNTSLVAPTGGSYLFNGTIVGGTIAANALTQSAGTLDGASITGSFTVPNGTSLTLKNNGGWTGTATFGAAGLSGGQLFLASDTILPTALVFTGSSSRLDNSSSIRTLTLTSTGTLTRTGAGSTSSFENIANGGIVTVNGGAFSSSGTLTNQAGGTIAVSAGASLSQTGVFTNNSGATATVTGAGSVLAVANLVNAGALVSDSSGLLSLTGAFTMANLGSITLTNGGTVELANGSTLTNATNLLPPTGGAFIFKGTIAGGTVAANALTQSAGTLDGASITGSFTVPNGTSLTLKNNGGWTGTATVGAAGLSGGQLFLASDTILSSGLVFTGSSSRLDNSSSIRTLTLTSTGTLTRTGTGSTASFENIANSGTVTVNGGSFSSSGTLTNQAGGTIAVSAGASLSQTGVFTNNSGATATVTGTGSALAVANLVNAGALVSDTNGLLSLTGAFTTANLGSITLTNGGTVELANGSILTNTGNLLPPTGGAYTFKGTIVGGTIDPLALIQSAGTLDGAVIVGSFTVPNGTSLTLKNNGGWTGTATIGTAGLSGGQLFLASDATLSSALVFTGSSSRLDNSSSTRTVTIASTGSVTRTGAGSTASFENVVNNGTIAVTGGTFSNAGTFTNQAGGSVSVSAGATISQSNTFAQTGGVLKIDGTFTAPATGANIMGGSVTGAGSATGNFTFNGGTLDPGAPLGTLTFAGNLTLTGGAITNLELGAGVNDRVTVNGGGNSLVFGGTLNILAVSTAFASGQTWNVFSFTGHSGSFATINLPFTSSGWVWDTSQLTTTGVLTLTTFVPVPEPSTYALLVAGLGLVFIVRRRGSSRRS